MYQSKLHRLLLKTLRDIAWTRSTKDEDNFRHVICSALYKRVSPSCVEIPSTRAGQGDINIFGRKIEIKYASAAKQVGIDSVSEDFDRLLAKEVEFCLVSMSTDTSASDDLLDSSIPLPAINPNNVTPDFGKTGIAPNSYRKIALFLSATYPHFTNITPAGAVGRPVYRYLSFEPGHSIARSCFLKTNQALVHVDTVGSREDGLISFLFKRADHVDIGDLAAVPWQDLAIPSMPQPVVIARHATVSAQLPTRKTVNGAPLVTTVAERDVLIFDLR